MQIPFLEILQMQYMEIKTKFSADVPMEKVWPVMKNAKNAPQDNIPVKKEILIIIIYNFNLKIVDPMGMTCKACISDRMECQGGDRIIIKAGFWRPHNLSD